MPGSSAAQPSQFPRDVLLYTVGASLLWLIISTSLLALEYHEVEHATRIVIALQPFSEETLQRLAEEGEERKRQQNWIHFGVWALIQLGVFLESVRVGNRIRERRAVRAQLQEATSRLEALTHQPALGYLRIDKRGNIVDVNDSWLSMHGLRNRDEAIGTPYSFEHEGETFPSTTSLVDAVTSGALPPIGETTHRQPDGSEVYHSYSFHPIGKNGTSNGIEGFIVDITGRKHAEKALWTSERRYRTLFENNIAGFALHEMIFDEQGVPVDYRFLDINAAFEEMLGLKRSEVIGRHARDLMPGLEQKWIELYGGVVTTGDPAHFEMWSEPLNRWFEIRAFSTDPGCFAVFFLDITERRVTSSTLQRSLDEKSALLKELHHRVKNNLQVISSLINLHSSALTDPSERELLKTYQRRIRSIALVHETMYREADLAHVDFGEFLRAAVSELHWSIHLPSVECRVNAEVHLLDVSTAIPCGMIVTELVTNALQHAFTRRERGTLSVTLRTTGDRTEILIEDDGVGFAVPEHRSMGATVGLFLVDVLIEQLGGTFEITSGATGTRCRMLVPPAR